jgi:DNA-binding FadR family transcriptional regulator
MTQLRREPLAEQAADALLDRIRGGEWALGQKLPGETTLAPQLGVGRSTIREAIRQLAGRGVLATRQGAGVFVTALDQPEDWHQLLLRADIVSVIEARIAIEVEASALAAERRTSAELLAMTRAAEERETHRSRIEEHVDTDTAFHRSIVAAAHNPILTELFDGLTPRSRQAMIGLLRLRGEFGSDADQRTHARILEAIADRDAQSAAMLTRDHLLALKARLPEAPSMS